MNGRGHVLIARAGALGDVLLLRRTIAGIVSAGHRASLLAPASAAALVGPGEVAEALPWDGPEMAALLAGEETGGPVESAIVSADVVIAFSRSAPVLGALAPRARRLVARDPAPPAGGPHASLWLAGALESLGVQEAPAPAPLLFTDAEAADARAATAVLPPGFVAVHPGSGSSAKNWPLERFVEVARRLGGGQPWLLVLGPAEEDLVAPVTTSAGGPPESSGSVPGALVARGVSVRGLAAMLARAGLYVGNDSGVSHLAAASGAPTLALFGPTDPAQWSPVGHSVLTLRTETGRLEDLAVDDVVAAAGRLRADCGGVARVL
jgi:ADP-heptose:LPS heptosyltransferase